MQSKQLVSAALAAVCALGLVDQAAAQDKGAKEKCYGIAKAGANDCANLSGTHSCAGQASADKDIADWKYVPKGQCKAEGGFSSEEARAKMQKK